MFNVQVTDESSDQCPVCGAQFSADDDVIAVNGSTEVVAHLRSLLPLRRKRKRHTSGEGKKRQRASQGRDAGSIALLEAAPVAAA